MPFIELNDLAAEQIPDSPIGSPLRGFGKTLVQLRTELSLMLGSRADVSSDRLNSWINDAYSEMATELDLEELRGTLRFDSVAGKVLYRIPDSVWSVSNAGIGSSDTSIELEILPNGLVMSPGDVVTLTAMLTSALVADVSDVRVQHLDKWELETYRAIPAADAGDAMAYCITGRYVILYPVPSESQSIVLDAWFRVKPLVNDADSPLIEPELHRGILLKARAIALDALLEFKKSILADNAYTRFMKSRPSKKAQEKENMEAGMRPVTSWDDIRELRGR